MIQRFRINRRVSTRSAFRAEGADRGFSDAQVAFRLEGACRGPAGQQTRTMGDVVQKFEQDQMSRPAVGGGELSSLPDLQPLDRHALEVVGDHQLVRHILKLAGFTGDADYTANKLLRQCKSIRGIVALPAGRLKLLFGLTDQQILSLRLLLEAGARISRDFIAPDDGLGGIGAIAAYCTLRLTRDNNPGARILYLDHDHSLILDESLQGRDSKGPLIQPNHILRRAVLLRASGIVIARGDISPSPDLFIRDHRTIARLVDDGEVLGITLVDYLVVSTAGYISWRDRLETVDGACHSNGHNNNPSNARGGGAASLQAGGNSPR